VYNAILKNALKEVFVPHNNNKEHGFSLLEIMVVLIIIGVMASIVAPRFIERADEAKVDSTKVQKVNILQA